MDTLLIQLYVLVCELYDTRRRTCWQRNSNNAKPAGITDQELVTIYWFAHLHGHFEKKAMLRLIHQCLAAVLPAITELSDLRRPTESFGSNLSVAQCRIASAPAGRTRTGS